VEYVWKILGGEIMKPVNETAVNNLVRQVEGECRRAMEDGSQQIDIETIRPMVKQSVSDAVLQAIVDEIHLVEEQYGIPQDFFEEQFMSYSSMIGKGLPIDKVLNAVKFSALVMGGITQVDAYEIVFPAKARQIRDRGQVCSSFATMYAQSKAVVTILKTAMLSPSVTYKPLEAMMLKKLVDITNGIGAREGDRVSATVQVNAALGILAYIKAPEDKGLVVNFGGDAMASAQQNLADQISKMVELQSMKLRSGQSINDVQRLGIVIEGEIDE
jgi:hypothetical protein